MGDPLCEVSECLSEPLYETRTQQQPLHAKQQTTFSTDPTHAECDGVFSMKNQDALVAVGDDTVGMLAAMDAILRTADPASIGLVQLSTLLTASAAALTAAPAAPSTGMTPSSYLYTCVVSWTSRNLLLLIVTSLLHSRFASCMPGTSIVVRGVFLFSGCSVGLHGLVLQRVPGYLQSLFCIPSQRLSTSSQQSLCAVCWCVP